MPSLPLAFHSLRFRVLMAVFLSILIIASLTSYLLYRSMNEQLELRTRTNLASFTKLLDEQLALRAQDLELALEILLSDPAVAELFAARDRAALLSRLLPVYETRLRSHYGITQFHFHTAPATSFLRLHRPMRYGDDLSQWRQSLVIANTEGRPVSGIEVTRTGPGLKVVLPVGGDLQVGSVELATTISTLLDTARSALGLDYAIGIERSVWERARCEEMLEARFRSPEAIYYELSSETMLELLPEAEKGRELQMVERSKRTFALASFPLNDFQRRPVGVITVADDVTGQVRAFRRQVWRAESLIALLALLFAWGSHRFLHRSLLRPLDRTTRLAHLVARGNLTADLGELDGDRAAEDEMSRLLDSLRLAMDYLQRMATVAEGIAEGKLSLTVEPRSSEDAFGQAFAKMLSNLRTTIAEIKDAAGSVGGSATGIRTSSDQLARRALDQETATGEASAAVVEMATQMESVTALAKELERTVAASADLTRQMGASMEEVAKSSGGLLPAVDETSATIEEMSSSIRSIAEKSKVADAAATEVEHAAAEGGEELKENLLGIEEANQDIAGVVDIIKQLTGQTHLLALNAAIEAARAGESGQGFAVVATEIRRLAESAKQASQRIDDLVETVQSRTAQGVELSERVLGRITAAVASMSELVSEVAAAIQIQSGGSEQILEVANRMRTSVHQVDALVRRHAEDARRVLSQSDTMRQMTLQVTEASHEQQKSGMLAVGAIEEIATVAKENRQASAALNQATDGLDREADRLEQTAAEFEV